MNCATASPCSSRLPELVLNDDKDGKPVGIQRHIGRRPIAAFGNSDGDFQMLEWTTSGKGARFGLIVHHTDAEREWAYDRESPHRQTRHGPRRSPETRLDRREHEGRLGDDLPAETMTIKPLPNHHGHLQV